MWILYTLNTKQVVVNIYVSKDKLGLNRNNNNNNNNNNDEDDHDDDDDDRINKNPIPKFKLYISIDAHEANKLTINTIMV